MLQPALHAENGFTLIEFMVALVIFMVGMLGLLETVNVAYRHNLSNNLRNDAILMADQLMAAQRIRPFADISTTTLKSAGFAKFSSAKTVTDLTATSKSVSVLVSWHERGLTKNHSLTTVITNGN